MEDHGMITSVVGGAVKYPVIRGEGTCRWWADQNDTARYWTQSSWLMVQKRMVSSKAH